MSPTMNFRAATFLVSTQKMTHCALYIPGEKSINPAAVLGALDSFLQQSGCVDFIDRKLLL